MSLKLKILGLGLLAVTAMGSVSAMNASAFVNGHFTNDATNNAGHALVVGTETVNTPHRLKFSIDGGTNLECTHAVYNGTVNSETVTSITVAPQYSQCRTETDENGKHPITVHPGDCTFVFHSNAAASVGHPPAGTATVTVVCPKSAGIVITHPNCTVRVPPQALSGVQYTTQTNATTEKHEVTVLSNVANITSHFEGGICIFLGTGGHSATMKGSATVKGTNTLGTQVNVTAT